MGNCDSSFTLARYAKFIPFSSYFRKNIYPAKVCEIKKIFWSKKVRLPQLKVLAARCKEPLDIFLAKELKKLIAKKITYAS